MSNISPAEHGSPFKAQREMHELLAQETRHHIIQTILGHPEHLASLSELAYYTQKSESAIIDQLGTLEENNFVTTYVLEESEDSRDLPSKFYGLTGWGLHVLDGFKYLRGIPVLRAIHDNTVKPERIRRHEESPRPDLPVSVAEALHFDEDLAEVEPTDSGTTPAIFAEKATEEEVGIFDDLFEE